MIGTYLSGRLGNQFFRYAYTRSILYQRGEKEEVIFNLKYVLDKDPNDGFEDVLKYFNVIPYKTSTHDLVFQLGNLKQKFIYLYYIFYAKILGRVFGNSHSRHLRSYRNMRNNGLLYASEDESNIEIPVPSSHNVIISGNFENSIYFNKIRPILLKEFTPKNEPLPQNKFLYDIINSTESVCITIRRGDYVEKFKGTHYLCDEEYFKKGMEIIKSKIENPVFIFFSDDIEWVRNSIDNLGVESYYESGSDPIWEKLRLMYSCKHFIISNSTFSWWAQYLSTNINKVVISPNRWYNANLNSSLIEQSFTLINV